MVRTGRRARELADLLAPVLGRPVPPPAAPRPRDLERSLADAIEALWVKLGGRPDQGGPLRPGAWDLAFSDGLLIELDEELHFNRYRALTLGTDWATDLPWTADYLRHASSAEPSCLAAGRWGRRWTSPSCEAMFGPASSPGDFSGGGAPRWKQRALYDALKDACALSSPAYRLARLSVHDDVGGRTLGQVLAAPGTQSPDQLEELLERRTTIRPC